MKALERRPPLLEIGGPRHLGHAPDTGATHLLAGRFVDTVGLCADEADAPVHAQHGGQAVVAAPSVEALGLGADPSRSAQRPREARTGGRDRTVGALRRTDGLVV